MYYHVQLSCYQRPTTRKLKMIIEIIRDPQRGEMEIKEGPLNTCGPIKFKTRKDGRFMRASSERSEMRSSSGVVKLDILRLRLSWGLDTRGCRLLRHRGVMPWRQRGSYTTTRSSSLTRRFCASLKHKDDGQKKFIKPNSQRQDIIIKYWVSIGSIHREQG